MRFAIFITIVLSISCQNTQQNSEQSAIIGEGDFVQFEQIKQQLLTSLTAKTSGIGVLDGECTAFHIGEGKVMTAGHCFSQFVKTGQACVSSRVEWYSGRSSQCIQVLYRTLDSSRDIAIFEVDPAPPEQFAMDLSREMKGITEPSITVLGFPKGQGLKVSLNCHIVSTDTKSSQFEHNCDSLPGNSGSPILTQDTWHVLGVHNGHRTPYNYGTDLGDWDTYEGIVRQVSENRSEGDSSQHGPFANNQSQLIHYFSSDLGPTVEIAINIDVEDGYDFVYVVDGTGRKRELTGQRNIQWNLMTPVVVSIETDYSGLSNSINVERVL